jgi:hypothetical protein
LAQVVMDGPPWGGYVDAEEAYVRGQAASTGSGALGGWGAVGDGGFFDEAADSEAEVREAIAVPARIEEKAHRKE